MEIYISSKLDTRVILESDPKIRLFGYLNSQTKFECKKGVVMPEQKSKEKLNF